ncbi:hypothetical protein V8B55DRAFT_1156571 [Mucor lusitanicus]|uniref:Complex 1 LYR protein domain-containing protein n=1 Tax=Mucor circinelloides f. lusitanicus TaxID=29924 RepID=A0A8H4F010_MUCCL|nr:hypothetical protein FB192DRAFT_1139885 [Mucor lusitanicus]
MIWKLHPSCQMLPTLPWQLSTILKFDIPEDLTCIFGTVVPACQWRIIDGFYYYKRENLSRCDDYKVCVHVDVVSFRHCALPPSSFYHCSQSLFHHTTTQSYHIMSSNLRPQVIALYKQLVYLGREYPAGYTDFFRPKLKAAFLKKRELTDEQEILKSIKFGEYIIKELEMMYYLRKYRTLRKRYNENQ